MNRTQRWNRGTAGAIVFLAAWGSGCVVETGGLAGVAVSGPPPQPVVESRPAPPPNVRVVWIAGYWHWSGMQYTWIPGHWETAPPGASWRGPRYSMRDGTYFYEPGGWMHR